MTRNRGGIFGSITFLLGLIFGGFLTLLLSTDEKGETRKEVKGKVREIKKSLKEVSERERIEAIFGDVSREATERYREAKAMLTARLAELKQAVDTINKEKYGNVVQDVVKELKKEGQMTATQLKKLSAYLAEDYQKITKKAKPTKDSA
jgi:gas vesicle protein